MALTRRHQLLVVAVGGVVAGVAVFVSLALLAGSGGVDLRLGDDVFEAGRAERLAEAVASGGPLLFSDAGGGNRDIYLVHLAATPDEGWVAFDARPPGSPRDCFLEWDAGTRTFVAPCTGATFPADGGGLRHYRVMVEDGRVEVDFRGTGP